MPKEKKFTIGRTDSCDIVLRDESVSRVHAELIFLPDGRFFLVDCKSRNGTVIIIGSQEKIVRQEYISPTDLLKFGDVKVQAKDILEAIQLKYLPTQHEPPNPSNRVTGDQLQRCSCGAIRQKSQPCKECQQ